MSFNQNLVQGIQTTLLKYGSLGTALLLISIYFSTSLTIILSALVGFLWMFSVRFMALPFLLKKTPVAAWSLLLFACFILGVSYSSASWRDAFSMVMKYRELIFIPILLPFLTTGQHRTRVWKAFIIASILTLLGSCLMNIGILEPHQGSFSFKSRITHGIFIAFFAFYCAHKAFCDKRYRGWYLSLLVVGAYNIFFMIEGRTGQLILIALVLLFAFQRFAVKGLLLSVLAVTVFLTLFLNFSEKAERITEGVENTEAYLKPEPEQTESSMGQRYTFWKYSLKLIAEKPLFGHGTGSFAKEYRRIAKGERFITENPHNEFFMIGVQLGIVGLLVYLGFLSSQYACAGKLPDQEKWLAQGILLSLIITSLFNTPFLDHTEGHWFAIMIALCFATLHQADDRIKSC
jgi:O-antigen ligase